MPINILDWHAGRVSHSGKMAIKKVEKVKNPRPKDVALICPLEGGSTLFASKLNVK